MSAAPNNYLETAVLTAPPQKLQLMLVEGCLRFGQRARQHLAEQRSEDAAEALLRCQEIAAQLLAGVNAEHDADLAKRARGVYLFVYRSLIEAQLRQDVKQLNEALAILEIERETWRLACEGPHATGAPTPHMTANSHSPAGFSLNA